MKEFPQLGTDIFKRLKKIHNLLHLIHIIKNNPITYNPNNKGLLRMFPWAWLHTGLHLLRTILQFTV